MLKKVIALCALAAIVAPAAHADDLFNQETGYNSNPNENGYWEEQDTSGTYASYDAFIANNVTVGGSGWTINSYQSLIQDSNNALPSISQARMFVFADGANSLPGGGDNPAAGGLVSVSMADTGTATYYGYEIYSMTASGLNVNVGAGQYWMGMTAQSSTSTNGFLYTETSTNPMGAADSAWIQPGNGFGYGSGWFDINDPSGPFGGLGNTAVAFDIQGHANTTPEPASLLALGAGAAVLLRRRRK